MTSPKTKVALSAATQFALAGFIELLHKDADAAERRDAGQLGLPFSGESQAIDAFMEERETLNQAIDAFMDEREELLAVVANRDDCIDALCASYSAEVASSGVYREGLQGEIARLRGEAETSNAVLLHIAEYATTLQARLNTMGISYVAGPDGTPHITVDHAAFAAAFIDI